MASLNKVMLIGNLGRDPEVKQTATGDLVATLALATKSVWNDKSGQKQENTEWHRVVFFGRQAEICQQYLKKGSSLYVEGKITTRKYIDKDGVEKYATDIRGDMMQMLDKKNDSNQPQHHEPQNNPYNNQNNYAKAAASSTARQHIQPISSSLDDDIPF
jgi:single-strand DNA-binding protein